MQDTRTIKKIFNSKPLTKRSQGRPKYRWEENNTQHICQMKIKNWIICVQGQGSAKRSLRRPKVSTRKFSARKNKKKKKKRERRSNRRRRSRRRRRRRKEEEEEEEIKE